MAPRRPAPYQAAISSRTRSSSGQPGVRPRSFSPPPSLFDKLRFFVGKVPNGHVAADLKRLILESFSLTCSCNRLLQEYGGQVITRSDSPDITHYLVEVPGRGDAAPSLLVETLTPDFVTPHTNHYHYQNIVNRYARAVLKSPRRPSADRQKERCVLDYRWVFKCVRDGKMYAETDSWKSCEIKVTLLPKSQAAPSAGGLNPVMTREGDVVGARSQSLRDRLEPATGVNDSPLKEIPFSNEWTGTGEHPVHAVLGRASGSTSISMRIGSGETNETSAKRQAASLAERIDGAQLYASSEDQAALSNRIGTSNPPSRVTVGTAMRPPLHLPSRNALPPLTSTRTYPNASSDMYPNHWSPSTEAPTSSTTIQTRLRPGALNSNGSSAVEPSTVPSTSLLSRLAPPLLDREGASETENDESEVDHLIEADISGHGSDPALSSYQDASVETAAATPAALFTASTLAGPSRSRANAGQELLTPSIATFGPNPRVNGHLSLTTQSSPVATAGIDRTIPVAPSRKFASRFISRNNIPSQSEGNASSSLVEDIKPDIILNPDLNLPFDLASHATSAAPRRVLRMSTTSSPRPPSAMPEVQWIPTPPKPPIPIIDLVSHPPTVIGEDSRHPSPENELDEPQIVPVHLTTTIRQYEDANYERPETPPLPPNEHEEADEEPENDVGTTGAIIVDRDDDEAIRGSSPAPLPFSRKRKNTTPLPSTRRSKRNHPDPTPPETRSPTYTPQYEPSRPTTPSPPHPSSPSPNLGPPHNLNLTAGSAPATAPGNSLVTSQSTAPEANPRPTSTSTSESPSPPRGESVYPVFTYCGNPVKFYLHDRAADDQSLRAIIESTVMGGIIVDSPSKASFSIAHMSKIEVVTQSSVERHVTQRALGVACGTVGVAHEWVIECFRKGKAVDYRPYEI